MYKKMLYTLHSLLLCLSMMVLLSSCAKEKLLLPCTIDPSALNYSSDAAKWTTVEDLSAEADCVVVAQMLAVEQFSPNGTWRYQMRLVDDIAGNMNTVGCDVDKFFVYAWSGDIYVEQNEYLLFLNGATIVGYPHIVYTELVPAMCIDVSTSTSTFTLNGSVEWDASETVLSATRSAINQSDVENILYTDTIASYEEALDAADEIWLIEIDEHVAEVNAYLDKYDYTILEVLKGTYDISQPGSESYRESLPVACGVEVGQKYLLLKEHTDGGRAKVSGEYCLIPADLALFQQTVESFSVIE